MNLSWKKAILILSVTPLICAVAGFAIGSAIGTALPEYYRTMFPHPRGPEFERVKDPVAVGQGLGLTQGFGTGVFIALVLLALMTWHSQRLLRRAEVEEIMDRLVELEQQVEQMRQMMQQSRSG